MRARLRLVLTPAVTPVLRFASWSFGPAAPCIDLTMFVLASAWAALMVLRPDIFDQGSFVGMQWLPDIVWIAVTILLAGLHLVGMIRLGWLNWRMVAALGSSWMWLCIAASFVRVDIGTGVFAYGLFGFWGLIGAIYVGGLPRRVR